MEIYKNAILAAGAANATGQNVDFTGCLASWALEVVVEATAATLQGSIVFGFGIEDAPTLNAGASMLLQRTQAPTGFTFTAATSTLALANPAIGRSSMILAAATPIKIVRPVWTYASGGGTFVVRVIAWGATYT